MIILLPMKVSLGWLLVFLVHHFALSHVILKKIERIDDEIHRMQKFMTAVMSRRIERGFERHRVVEDYFVP